MRITPGGRGQVLLEDVWLIGVFNETARFFPRSRGRRQTGSGGGSGRGRGCSCGHAGCGLVPTLHAAPS